MLIFYTFGESLKLKVHSLEGRLRSRISTLISVIRRYQVYILLCYCLDLFVLGFYHDFGLMFKLSKKLSVPTVIMLDLEIL